jgi:general stress protein YciG
MKIEIIQNPNGTFAVYEGNTLIADHYKMRSDAEARSASRQAAVALGRLGGSANTPAQLEARQKTARENGKKGGRPRKASQQNHGISPKKSKH